MSYVRQHYNLATTGKLGQKASGKAAQSSAKKPSHSGGSMKKSGSYGSHGSQRKG